MKNFRLFGSATLSILATVALVMSAWQIAAGLAVAALLVLLLPSTATNAQGPERGSTKHSKNEIKQIRDYRKSNPSASLVEAVRAVEGRGK
ncbi:MULTISPECIES: hypothetical protein [Glutamicibacter]|nr:MULTISPECIES: hypothetical protein [Glutamicibacter]HCJ53932.1 hypothetical protein [Glutamicibacter sp.]HCM94237.1 hypothetical protein [Glutamicibacter sp.]